MAIKDGHSQNKLYIWHCPDGAKDIVGKIYWIKLVEGDSTTDEWTPNPKEQLYWEFSANKGIRLWSSDTTENPLFEVKYDAANEKGNLHLNGTGVFDGTIYARSGQIGNLTIEDAVTKINNAVSSNVED